MQNDNTTHICSFCGGVDLRLELIRCAAHLAAAISLLENSPKSAAPSDKMFDQMLDDYRKSLASARRRLDPYDTEQNRKSERTHE